MMAKTKPCWAEVAGPLAEYAAGFRDELFRLGYTPLTAACQVRLTAQLSRWMAAGVRVTRNGVSYEMAFAAIFHTMGDDMLAGFGLNYLNERITPGLPGPTQA